MTLPRRLVTPLALAAAALAQLGLAAPAHAVPPTHALDANVNDPAIVTARGQNLVWVQSDPARRAGKLLVIMAGGGANNLPPEWSELGSEGARLGYHTIVLAYSNAVPVAAAPPAGCGNSVDPPATPPDCALNARMEILDGRGESPLIDVDRANSIENRLTKALQHLAATYPGEGWAPFLDTSGAEPAPMWSQTVVSGQSLGAGQAVLIGMVHAVHRVVAFAGWTDAKHGWVAPGMTPSNRYAALIHQRDNFFERTCYAYAALGLAASCPLPGFALPPDPANPLLIENRQPPFGTSQLVINLAPAPNPPAVVGDPNHTSTTRDGWIAREPDGVTLSHKLIGAWRSVLGDSDADTFLDQVDNCPLAANTVQADGDGDGIGDACDPVFTTNGSVGGSVAATLALSLGGAASFGAFTPGVGMDYFAAATANVISTGGDAALSVADPSATAPGHLVNGAFSLPQGLQARANPASAFVPIGPAPALLLTYTAPIANDPVPLEFKQVIAANDALRSGAYSKTLTFTLSTTTP